MYHIGHMKLYLTLNLEFELEGWSSRRTSNQKKEWKTLTVDIVTMR